MAKMGISTLYSYKGAQIFEPLGLSSDVTNKCFRGSPSRLGGLSFSELGSEALQRHRLAFTQHGSFGTVHNLANNPGFYHWRKGGEKHLNEPECVAALQEAAKLNSRSAPTPLLSFHSIITVGARQFVHTTFRTKTKTRHFVQKRNQTFRTKRNQTFRTKTKPDISCNLYTTYYYNVVSYVRIPLVP